MKLFYRKMGEGPNLIILHGLLGMSDNWLSIGKELSKNFKVFLVDQRNHGQSPHSDIHNYEAMQDDLLELMNDLDIQSTHLIGHSMGGKTAMLFAADYPEKVKSLIVIDITPKNYLSHPDFNRNAQKVRALLEIMRHLVFTKYKTMGEIDNDLKKKLPEMQFRQLVLKNIRRSVNNGFQWKLNLDVLSENISFILAGLDEKKYMPGFHAFPSLFIRDQKSNYILDEDIPIIEKAFAGSEIITIPDAGHWLHIEQPALLNKVMQDFLKGRN